MGDILQWHVQMYFLEWKFRIPSSISLTCVSNGLVGSKSTSVQAMDLCRQEQAVDTGL